LERRQRYEKIWRIQSLKFIKTKTRFKNKNKTYLNLTCIKHYWYLIHF
jgi:hypothetical protein